MKLLTFLALLSLAACGDAARNNAAESAQTTSTDAVTAEAVRDTQAAEVDAMKAADAELDNLGDTIDDAGRGTGNRTGKAGGAVSNTTKIEVY